MTTSARTPAGGTPPGRGEEPRITESSEHWTIRHAPGLGELIASVKDAAWFNPLDWPRSVFGDLSSMGRAPYSEYNLLWSGNLPRLARYLADTVTPSVPGRAPAWLRPPLSSLFFHESHELKDAGRADGRPFAGETWFFINGILTNQDVARLNAAYLVHLFGRPINVLWNSTDGIGADLLECSTEKLGATGEDVDSAFHPLLDAISSPQNERVVLISHSQGTLITAVVLRLIGGVYRATMGGKRGDLSKADRETIRRNAAAEGLTVDPRRLKPVTPAELAKLEVYCFANCASDMHYIDPTRQIPTIESYGNEHDLVARLGMLAPDVRQCDIEIAGPRFKHNGAWGHLLNAHYLRAIDEAHRRPPGAGEARHDAAPYVSIEGTAAPEAVPGLFRYLGGAGSAAGRGDS
jgi:hypothetical protein